MNSTSFLTAEWQKLAFANYAVDPAILIPFLPAHTELDYWENQCYVSLVGFMFLKTRLRGIRIPLHSNFPEVNLRFYVRFKDQGKWKRGVTFIHEFVPKRALTLVANLIYQEPYETLPMHHEWIYGTDDLSVMYQWKKRTWNRFQITAAKDPAIINENSREEFITEHYWGYTRLDEQTTSQYQVAHPRWEIYPVLNHSIQVDFGSLYGMPFAFLSDQKPGFIMLVEGSSIRVMKGGRI
ncbi:MAG: YqjF family protein [Chitinophagales bacterium]